MSRRLRTAALTAFAVLLATVGTAVPASAATFSGVVITTVTIGPALTVGGTGQVAFDASTLSPAAASMSVTVTQQPLTGGAILPYLGSVVTSGVPTLSPTITLSPIDASAVDSYLMITATFTGSSGELYVATGQLTVTAATLSASGSAVPVSGTARVGGTLTADAGTSWWSPAADTVSYTWWDAELGTQIGTGASYALTAADLDRVVYVEAVATRAGYASSTVASSFVGRVGAGELTLVSAPQIASSVSVGEAVTATAPEVTPAADSIDYQWYLQDGTAIDGATSATYTPGSAQLGESLYVVATAHRASYQDYVSASNLSGAVALAQQTLTAAPTVSSSASVGVALTATAPTFAVAPDSIGYQWYLDDGTPIDGATSATYVPTSAEIGSQLYVVATAERAGAQTYQVASNLTGAVALRSFTSAPTPTITGTALLGTVLTVDVHADEWAPAAQSFTYQWFRASESDTVGQAIDGATSASYAPTAADAGSWFFVEVTAHAASTTSYVIGSAPSRTVQLPWLAAADGSDQVETVVGGQLKVQLHALTPGVEYQLELHSDPVSLGSVTAGADGSALVDVTLPGSVTAGTHTLVVLRDGVSVLEIQVVVTADSATTTTLASTGGTLGPGTAAAGALLVLGAWLVALRRRSRLA
ncbi:MAG TPA: hypothetical protein VGC67_03720 [Cellulomonas sp.]